MKLNPHYLKHQMGDRTLVIPTAAARFHGLVQGNRTVAGILSRLKKIGAIDE